ncbi:hypothetical protein ACLE20_05435 [Rhizobium sp. YIM 134829]|uniref:hypothetical protein n=1 Tax=Rhizobium sp. YIM 134829 TaxID=3390453 RepID=UPI00397BC17A
MSDTYPADDFYGADTDPVDLSSLPFEASDSFDFTDLIPATETAPLDGELSEITFTIDLATPELGDASPITDGADVTPLVGLPHLDDLAP